MQDSDDLPFPFPVRPGMALPAFTMPTEEELFAGASRRYALSGPFNIDQWPAEVAALSFPTKMIEITDLNEFVEIFDGNTAVMDRYAAILDEAMGWDNYFIRLNSRSPKDSAYPGLPITCSGKQAMAWIANSERCLDDTCLHKNARQPLYICLRQWQPMMPGAEFRCFAKDGKLLAVSRYDYDNPSVIPEEMAPQIWDAAKAFYDAHLKAHYETVVFDLYAPGRENQVLIELNPYGLSDPCLFGDYDQVEQGGIRVGNL